MEEKTAAQPNQIKFLSCPWNILGAIIIGCIIIVYTYLTYSIQTSHIFERGTWLVLGGFSLFYPTGGFMLAFVLVLTIGFVFNLKQVTLASGLAGAIPTIIIQEKMWGLIPLTTNVESTAIKFVKLETGRFGNKLIWVFILGSHAVYLLNDGLHLILSPVLFGYGSENATILIITGIVDIIMLLIIVLPGENHLELHTENEFHVLSFHLSRNRYAMQQAILGMFGSKIQQQPENKKTFTSTPSALSNKLIVYGLLFWSIALMARIFDIYAGSPLRLVLYFTGWACVFYGMKFRLSKKESWQIFMPESKQLEFHIHAIAAQTHLIMKGSNEADGNMKLETAHLPSMIMIGLLGLFLFMGWTHAAWIRFTWCVSSMLGYTLLFLFVDAIVSFFLLDLVFETSLSVSVPAPSPQNPLKIPQLNIGNIKNVLQEEDGSDSHISYRFWIRWKNNWQMNNPEKRKAIGLIAIVFIIGIICAFV
jgi:hypothetical protein